VDDNVSALSLFDRFLIPLSPHPFSLIHEIAFFHPSVVFLFSPVCTDGSVGLCVMAFSFCFEKSVLIVCGEGECMRWCF